MVPASNAEKVDWYSLDTITQSCFCRATRHFISRAMANDALWARVQEKKEEMYADGRLQRSEEYEKE